MKLLSIAVPCYNSEAYMENCIKSLLVGGDEVEILIVDDGSGDGTAQIADRLEREHPGIVRAIHQPNKGHGGAVNTGIENATGLYFKVVDSDDKVRASAYKSILDVLRRFSGEEEPLDLLISNFVYNKEDQNRHKVMEYRHCLPVGRVFSWDEANRFPIGKYILMHSVIFRTQMLRNGCMEMIGDRKALKQYMFNYLEIITTITSVLALRSGKEEHIRLRDETWEYLREKDEALYKKMRRRILGRAMNVNRRFPRMAVISAYHIAQRIFNFN